MRGEGVIDVAMEMNRKKKGNNDVKEKKQKRKKMMSFRVKTTAIVTI